MLSADHITLICGHADLPVFLRHQMKMNNFASCDYSFPQALNTEP